MWKRQEVKRKGKTAFFAGYWKFVLVALIIGAVTGGASGLSSGFSSMGSSLGNAISNRAHSHDNYYFEDGRLHVEGEGENEESVDVDIRDGNISIEGIDEDLNANIRIENGNIYINDIAAGDNFDITTKDGRTTVSGVGENGEEFSYTFDPKGLNITLNGHSIELTKDTIGAAAGAVVAIVVAVVIIVTIISLIAAAFTIALDVFVMNPIEYGCQKFLRKSQKGNESLGTIFTGFRDGYKNIVKVLFFRDLFITLWSLLFIIPGIVKSYEYRMVPFILSENPTMSKDEALKASSAMMKGQKWRTFLLDLSFLGWHLLSIPTLGVIEIFYVAPYVHSTNAALYETLKGEDKSVVAAES